MAMQINGNYAQSKTDYAERVREKQAALKAEKAKEAKETKEAAEEKGSGKLSEPQDVYISSEKSGKEPVGLYRIGQDENGGRKIFFEDPDKADRAASGDDTPSGNKGEKKIQELEKKLAQVEQELSQKDNDTYRKQHSEFSRMA